MKKSKTEKALSKIAKKHGVTKEEVRNNIQEAIDDAMSSQEPLAFAFWQEVREKGIKPTPENISDIIFEVGLKNFEENHDMPESKITIISEID